MFPSSKLRVLIIASLWGVLTLCAGCSALRIGYSTAPDIVYWWLDGYVDLNAAQTVRVREAIAQWFAWNRRSQLPDVAALLARAKVEVLSDTTPRRVCEWQADLTGRARTAFERIAPAAADLMLTLTPAQWQVLERRYAKNNDEFRQDYLQPDLQERAKQTLKRAVDRAETLYGTLDAAQRARMAEILSHSPFDPELWLTERRHRQQDMLQMLRRLSGEGAGREQAVEALQGYVRSLELSPRETYRQYDEQLAAFNCAAVAKLHNATTVAQRQSAAQRLNGWEEDLRAIAASVPAEPR